MEQAFAAGDPPLGLSAEMHAAALAWVPPGFAAFDTGRVDDEADDAVTAAPEQAADASGPEPVAEAETGGVPADGAPTASAVESIDPAAAPNASPPHRPPRTVTVMPNRPHRKPVPPAPMTATMAVITGQIAGTAGTAIPEDVRRGGRRDAACRTSTAATRLRIRIRWKSPSSCAAFTDRSPEPSQRPARHIAPAHRAPAPASRAGGHAGRGVSVSTPLTEVHA